MASQKAERRSRGEIDRNYFFGDVFIKTGVAVALAIGLIAAYTSTSLAQAVTHGDWAYLSIMVGFGAAGAVLFLFGRHLRKTATHWDFD
ncbi:MAG: hypothetical protein GC189_06095 [Alphaproteobacteria bacterium]|nr:hypothetical protein [Alphaproteobacteria bacterium]